MGKDHQAQLTIRQTQCTHFLCFFSSSALRPTCSSKCRRRSAMSWFPRCSLRRRLAICRLESSLSATALANCQQTHHWHYHRRRRFWHATHDCVAPYVDIILHRGRFWAKSAASRSVRWWCFRSCWMVPSHVMRGRPSCLLQSAGGEPNRILLASALSSMHIICPNKVSRRDWIIAVSLGCFVSLRTSSFRTNWYHLMPSSIRKHHWSSASILRASVFNYESLSRWDTNPIKSNQVVYLYGTLHIASNDAVCALQPWY